MTTDRPDDSVSGKPYSPPIWEQGGAMPPPAPPYVGQPYPGGPHEPPKKRSWPARHKILTGVLGLAALFTVGGIAGSLAGGDGGGGKALAPAASPSVTVPAPPPLPPEQEAANSSAANAPAAPAVPSAKDFKLTIKTLSKQCFGDAGCNIEYRVTLAYVGAGTLPDDSSYEVTYAVRGDESGPQTDTITTHGMEYDQPYENVASTPSSATKLTVKVTGVEDVS